MLSSQASSQQEGLIRVLHKLVEAEDGVVGLDHGVGNLQLPTCGGSLMKPDEMLQKPRKPRRKITDRRVPPLGRGSPRRSP